MDETSPLLWIHIFIQIVQALSFEVYVHKNAQVIMMQIMNYHKVITPCGHLPNLEIKLYSHCRSPFLWLALRSHSPDFSHHRPVVPPPKVERNGILINTLLCLAFHLTFNVWDSSTVWPVAVVLVTVWLCHNFFIYSTVQGFKLFHIEKLLEVVLLWTSPHNHLVTCASTFGGCTSRSAVAGWIFVQFW